MPHESQRQDDLGDRVPASSIAPPQSLDEFLRELEKKYGPDVRFLAKDDERLLSYLEGGNQPQMHLAMLSLIHFHTVYPERILNFAAEYIIDGCDLETRFLCVQYLGRSRDEAINSVLRECGTRLQSRQPRPGDREVLVSIARSLKLQEDAPRVYGEVLSMANEILARLRSHGGSTASERGQDI
jgi:hypothetical protein